MAASSSSSSAAAAKKYDVFISFRGEDTRQGFISHLYDALCRSSIKAFIDRELSKGDEISPSLFQSIQDSYGSLVVFSQNYASSKWCLKELLKILECRNQGHFVIPIFYNIDPSHVRKQTESYGEALAKHEGDSNNDKAMLQKWKAALTEAANIVGWDSESRNNRNESELIGSIVKDVSQRLDYAYQPSKLGLVGIDQRCEHIEALLQEFPVVGIWGMGGIGKTALAKVVFGKLSSQYDSCCFLENVREKSQRRGPNQLLQKLLFELLKDDIVFVNPQEVEGLKHAIRRLNNKNVFIVLDDVDNYDQLEFLGQECKILGPKSRVIITTRDRHLLTSLRIKYEVYEVEGLSSKDSFDLFRLNAFKEEDCPKIGYEEITEKIINYTRGTPLALKILGKFLCLKSREEWESAWKKLMKMPNKNIEKVLKLSYDGLDDEEKLIFLDVVCFLIGKNEKEIINLLDNFGYKGGAIGLRTLQDRALITISYINTVEMHHLIQEMGRQIVREESVEPRRRSRLWDPEEVYDILKYNKGTRKVEGITLNMSQIKDLHLSANSFKKMTSLRYLNFYSSNFDKSSKIHASGDTQLFSDKLRYLRWDKCPLWSLSSNFCAEKLVELKLRNSNVKKLWNGVQDLQNLKSLELGGSKRLKKLPDFSKASSLRWVELSDCTNLRDIHSSILSSHTLEYLFVNGCKKLKRLQSQVHLKSLVCLRFKGCSSLREFSLSSENLKELVIEGTALEIVHSSIGLCKNLVSLILRDSLKNISSDLSKLTSLTSLTIGRCTELDSLNLHIILGGLLSLREIRLRDCVNLSQFPDNIKYLSYLSYLGILDCEKLPYISELPASIEIVDLINCTSLETIMIPKSVQYKQSGYFLVNCVKLDEHSLTSIMELTYFRIKQAAAGAPFEDDEDDYYFNDNNIFSPGNRVPSWFGHKAANNWISIDIPPRSHLLGFAFYCILSPEFLPHRGKYSAECECDCYLESSQSMVIKSSGFYLNIDVENDIGLISDHVCIWYNRRDCNALFNEMEEQKAKGRRTKKLSFEFHVRQRKEWIGSVNKIYSAIKECGVWPIYASEYDISIDDLEQREGIELGYRTDDIDERVDLQFNELGSSANATAFTSSVFVHRDQDISILNARQDLPEVNSLGLLNRDRFNELDYPTTPMELDLELGFGNKSKRCQGMDDHQPFQRKKFSRCQDIGELSGGASTSGIGVGCSEFALQPLIQTNTINEFIFRPPPTDISMQNTWLDSSQLNSTCLLDRFAEFDNSIKQFNQSGFCMDLNEMPMDGNSFDLDQQSPSSSLWLNQGDPQMNLLEGIEGCSQNNQQEREQLVTRNFIHFL